MLMETVNGDIKIDPGYLETEDKDFKVDLTVVDGVKIYIFHTKQFSKPVSWFEYNMDESTLDFIMSDGDVRNFGIPVQQDIAKILQNVYQVMMVMIEDESGDVIEDDSYPLIVHRTYN